MAKHLNGLVDSMTYDNLIADMTPPVKVASGVICKLAAADDYKRGTVLAKSTADGKLYILGSTPAGGDTLTPDSILCDEEHIGSAADENAAVYVSGCFNIDALTMKQGYTMTGADKDKLRERGIYLSQMFE